MIIQRDFLILSSAKYLPQQVMTSAELDKKLQLPPGTAFKKSGVAKRHYMQYETIASMASAAITLALKNAQLDYDDIDALVFAAASSEQPIPCTAAVIQRELGYGDKKTPCFDINATCLSFLSALDLLTSALAVARYKKVIIVSAESCLAHINPKQIETAALFGDGACAFILGQPIDKNRSSILASHMETYADAASLCEIKGGGKTLPAMDYTADRHLDFCFNMEGPKLFKKTLKNIDHFLAELFSKCDYCIDQIDIVVPHQASRAALNLIQKKIPISKEKWIDILEDHGNQIAASIPTAFHEALQTGRIKKGMLVLLIGTGAGVSLSAQIIKY